MFFVRTAMHEDLPRVREILVNTWHATYDHIYGVHKVTEITNSWHTIDRLSAHLTRPNSEFLVADNGQIVGGMAFATQTDKTIHLHQLYVEPKYHGGKTGLHLLIEIENAFIDAELIALEVEQKNTRAIAFYKKYGFNQVGQTKDCSQSGFGIPALKMEKSILYADDMDEGGLPEPLISSSKEFTLTQTLKKSDE